MKANKQVVMLLLFVFAFLVLRAVYGFTFSEPKTYEVLVKSRVFSFVVRSMMNTSNHDVEYMTKEALAKFGTDKEREMLQDMFIKNGEDVYSTEFEVLLYYGYPGMLKYALKHYDEAKINIKWYMARSMKNYKNDPLYPQLLSKLKSEDEPFLNKQLPE
jgi:hypothetical protein